MAKKPKDILDRLARRTKNESKGHYTFSLHKGLMVDFKKACKKKKVKMTPVIEEFVRSFVEEYGE